MLEFHHPRWLIPFPFFDLGKHESYEDQAQTRLDGLSYLDGVVAPILSFLSGFEANQPIKLGALISGPLLTLLSQRPRLIDQIRQLTQLGRLELLGTTMVPSLGLLSGQDEFNSQLAAYRQLLSSYWFDIPTVYVGHGLVYCDDMAPIVKIQGYSHIVVPSRASEINNFTIRSAFLADKMNVLPAETIGNPELPENMADWLSSDLCLFKFKSSWGLSTLEKCVKQLMSYLKASSTTGVSFQLPGNLALKLPYSTVYSSREYISNAKPDQDLSYWLGNVMQQEWFDKVRELAYKLGEKKDPFGRRQLMLLQQVEILESLHTNRSQPNVEKLIIPSSMSWREVYIYLMNILADFEMYLNQRSTHEDINPE